MRRTSRHNRAFSLTEVLIATGILTVGFMLVAGTFPVGVKLTAVSTERTIATTVAEEAVAKIRLHGVNEDLLRRTEFAVVSFNPGPDAPTNRMVPYQYDDRDFVATASSRYSIIPPASVESVEAAIVRLNPGILETSLRQNVIWFYDDLRFYPSAVDYKVAPGTTDLLPPAQRPCDGEPRNYYWTALCRRSETSPYDIQGVVFVTRKAGQAAKYPRREVVRVQDSLGQSLWMMGPWQPQLGDYPVPVPILVERAYDAATGYVDSIRVSDGSETGDNIAADVQLRLTSYFTQGAVLVDGVTGQLMRVQERAPLDASDANGRRIVLVNLNRAGDASLPFGLFDARVDSSNPPEPILPPERYVWLVPPAATPSTQAGPPPVQGRCPEVGVYPFTIPVE